MSDTPNHETPQAHIQWKGTNVCLDFYCPCAPADTSAHFDGDFAYALRCERCGTVYQMPNMVDLTAIPPDTTDENHAYWRDHPKTPRDDYWTGENAP